MLPNDFWDRAPIVRRGLIFRAMAEAVATPIRDDELIVGDVPYDGFLANREFLPPHLTVSEQEERRAQVAATGRQTTGDRGTTEGLDTVFGMGRNFGHIIADYRLPLRLGFGGIRKEIEQRLASLPEEEAEARDLLAAARLTVRGAEGYIRRFGEEALRLAGLRGQRARRSQEEAERRSGLEGDTEPGAEHRPELEQIALVCRHVASESPRSFREALQLVWLTQLLLEMESGVSAFSFGRLDQYLYPYLESDLADGVLALEEAQELVDCFWVKANEQNDRCVDAGRAITIGGRGHDGEDLTNELTHMMLAAAERLRLKQPKLNARTHAGSPPEYLRRCGQVAAHNVGPQLYNDEEIVPSLEDFGFPAEDAVEYGIIGCYETGIPGRERPWPMAGRLDLAKCLELALNDGVCRLSGRQMGPAAGRLSQFSSYEEVEEAYHRQVVHFVRQMVDADAAEERLDEALRPQPFLSTLVDGCIESGQDVSAGGARYTSVGIRCTGFSAVVDSLAALKEQVHERGQIPPAAMEVALSENFASSEAMRRMLHERPPKYGNNDEATDQIARRVGEQFCREVLGHRNIRGGRFKPGLFSFTNFLAAGKVCGALPCGRRAGQPFANGASPMPGADRHGPTAMLQSASRLNYRLSPNCTTLDLRLSPAAVEDEAGPDRIGQLVRSYFDLGGMQLQLTVLSSDDLRAARERPEDYAHVLVRVAGYSAYFVDLAADVQEEIIHRTEHSP